MQFNDEWGYQSGARLYSIPTVSPPCGDLPREECIKLAFDSNPEIEEAKAEVEKAGRWRPSGKREYIPDVETIARYSHRTNVPFLARISEHLASIQL